MLQHNVIVRPPQISQFAPRSNRLKMLTSRPHQVRRYFEQSGAERKKDGVGQAGAMHTHQDVGVGDESQLLVHRQRVDLDAGGLHFRHLFTDVGDQTGLVVHLSHNESSRVARVRDVVPPPDEQHRQLIAVNSPVVRHVVTRQEEAAEFLEQRRTRAQVDLHRTAVAHDVPRHAPEASFRRQRRQSKSGIEQLRPDGVERSVRVSVEYQDVGVFGSAAEKLHHQERVVPVSHRVIEIHVLVSLYGDCERVELQRFAARITAVRFQRSHPTI